MLSAKKERLIGVMIVHNLALGNHQFGLTFSKKGIGQTSSRIGFPWISMDPQNISKHDGIELHIKRSNSWAL